MIDTLKIKDKVLLKNKQIRTIYNIFKSNNLNKTIYGLGLDPEHPGNFEWYYEDGKPVTYWANTNIVKTIFEPKTIIKIIKNI